MSETVEQVFRDRVEIVLAGHVAQVFLARPDKLNAIDPDMFDAIIEAGEWLAARTDVRAVVLAGRGRMFCAGLDFASFAAMASGEDAASDLPPLEERTHGLANRPQHACLLWRDLPVPVIAAIEGGALGGGLQIALGADLRILHPDAQMAIAEIRWGLVPDMGGIDLLRGLVRDDHLRSLTYTGRSVVGEDAVALGLATETAGDPLARALELAHEIAGSSPTAMRGAKRLLNLAADSDRAHILMQESIEQARLMGSADQVEAVMARMEKRAPVFSG